MILHASESNLGYRSLIILKYNVLNYSHTQYQIKIIYLHNMGKGPGHSDFFLLASGLGHWTSGGLGGHMRQAGRLRGVTSHLAMQLLASCGLLVGSSTI
jgi:hypothetical protein